MKVNIITQPLFCNYGGILQNYALQETLRRLGHEVLTVNVPVREITSYPDWKSYAHAVINLIKKIRNEYDYPFINPHTFSRKERELCFPQREFVDKHIAKKDRSVPFTPRLCDELQADAWIVGSDQVWRPWCSPNIVNYFFDFILNPEIIKVSYAASFGTDQWEISLDETPRVRELAKKFNAISVREKSGVNLCKEYLEVDAVHVLDPTMLLTARDYLSLTDEKDAPEGNYIATYILDTDRIKYKTVKQESRDKNLPIVKAGQMHRDRFDSVESWLSTLAHADRVITDSFHGTVFSIIFNRPVRILTNNTRGNSRLDSLISTLDIKPDDSGYYISTPAVKDRINALKSHSLGFLEDALQQI